MTNNQRYNNKEEYAAMIRACRLVVEKIQSFEYDLTLLYASAVEHGPVDLNNHPLRRKRLKVKEEVGLLPDGS